MWTYTGPEDSPLAGLASAPAWDGRTGRVLIVDTEGTPTVLSSGGTEAFSIDAAASSGVAVKSSLIIDDYMVSAGSSARVVRIYYYGGDDGNVYVIQTDR